MKKIDYEKTQFNAGTLADPSKSYGTLKAIWHTDSEGKYWCGNWYHRTPQQLLEECRSVILDLIINHPELLKDDNSRF